MKLDISTILNKLTPVIDIFKRYHMFLFIICFLGIYTFLVMQINTLVHSDPPAQTATEAESIKRLQVDEDAIERILELEEQNIEIQTLFEQARENPFNE
ncbi:MAG: hypothetical protein U5K77_02625 [Candidatus Saccharibacteria bacterium]|nr:hypothetical protein [Candidatus Saccharibacteria bacterium]